VKGQPWLKYLQKIGLEAPQENLEHPGFLEQKSIVARGSPPPPARNNNNLGQRAILMGVIGRRKDR
jgi:hypothetical protein